MLGAGTPLALGGFALTLTSAGLRWGLLHRSVEDSLELGGTMGGTWFVLWGLLGWLRLRGLDRDRRVPPDLTTVARGVTARETRRNRARPTVRWHVTAARARRQLKPLYPHPA